MESVRVLAVHGFLGQPSDWNDVEVEFKKIQNAEWVSLDLNAFMKNHPEANDFSSLTTLLCNELSKTHTYFDLLCGYSFGGRLGLHMTEQAPDFFRKLVMMSAQIGLPENASIERQARMTNDMRWADRFEMEDFNETLVAWNKQDVFKNSSEPLRVEENYDRKTLGSILRNFSLALQKDFEPWVAANGRKVSWFYGEKDHKYKTIGEDLRKEKYEISIHEIKAAGHRMIFDQPRTVAEEIKKVTS